MMRQQVGHDKDEDNVTIALIVRPLALAAVPSIPTLPPICTAAARGLPCLDIAPLPRNTLPIQVQVNQLYQESCFNIAHACGYGCGYSYALWCTQFCKNPLHQYGYCSRYKLQNSFAQDANICSFARLFVIEF